jgi:Transposase.
MEQLVKVPRQRRTNQQILQLLNEFNKSGMKVIDFCKEKDIHVGNFHKWKSRYKSVTASSNKKQAFAKLDVIGSASSASLFAEVNGIRLYQPVSASFLKELL